VLEIERNDGLGLESLGDGDDEGVHETEPQRPV